MSIERSVTRARYERHYSAALQRRCLQEMHRTCVGRGARLRTARRAMYVWRRGAAKVRSLRLRSAVQAASCQRRRVASAWGAWRRERHVGTIVTVYAVDRLQSGTGMQLGLQALARWRGDDAMDALVSAWRAWRRSVRR
jgi:hypothetical protein